MLKYSRPESSMNTYRIESPGSFILRNALSFLSPPRWKKPFCALLLLIVANANSGLSAPIPGKNSGRITFTLYKVKAGDTLMTIAFRLYGDMGRWKDIADWNRDAPFSLNPLKESAALRVAVPPLETSSKADVSRCRFLLDPLAAEIEAGKCSTADRDLVKRELAYPRICFGQIQCEGSAEISNCACEPPTPPDFATPKSFCPTADECLRRCQKSVPGPARIGNPRAGICVYGEVKDPKWKLPVLGACLGRGNSCPDAKDCISDPCVETRPADRRGISYGQRAIE